MARIDELLKAAKAEMIKMVSEREFTKEETNQMTIEDLRIFRMICLEMYVSKTLNEVANKNFIMFMNDKRPQSL